MALIIELEMFRLALKITRETEILSPSGSRMTKGDNAKYILCHSGTSLSEVIESK